MRYLLQEIGTKYKTNQHVEHLFQTYDCNCEIWNYREVIRCCVIQKPSDLVLQALRHVPTKVLIFLLMRITCYIIWKNPAQSPTQPKIKWVPGLYPEESSKGSGADHPPASSAEVNGRVELYLFSPCGPSLLILGWNLTWLYNQANSNVEL